MQIGALLSSLVLCGCPLEISDRRVEVADFGEARLYVLPERGDGTDFGVRQFGGVGLEIVTNAEWMGDRWSRIDATDVYKLGLDTRGLNLFIHTTTQSDTWSDALKPGEWAEIFNVNHRAIAFHRDVYAFNHQFRFIADTQTAEGANPPPDAPLINTITAKSTLKAWAAYTAAGDGVSLKLLDGVNVAAVTALDDGRAARVTLAAAIDGTPAVEAHYNHSSLANPYRMIVTRQVTGAYVDVEHYDVAHQTLRDQRAQDHGVTYVFVYGRQD